MPHVIVEHSARLAQSHDMQAFSDMLRDAAVDTGIFPLAGTRVRLYAADIETIADGDPGNAYVAIILRIGAGRDETTRKRAGQALFDAARGFFKTEMDTGYFMLSLDMQINDPAVSFKENGVHRRLAEGASP